MENLTCGLMPVPPMPAKPPPKPAAPSRGSASGKGPEVNKEADDRLAMLRELAKLTKPTGKSSQGKGEEVDD